MFSVAFFSLASLALSAFASPLAYNGATPAPDVVDKKVDGALETAPKSPSAPHVPRHDTTPDAVTIFFAEFEIPLAKVESLVSGTPNPETLAKVMVPALVELITPMSKLVGYFVGQTGVSVEGNTVTVDAQQTIETVNVYAARLTICLGKASDLVGSQLSEIKMTIATVTAMFTTVVYTVGIISRVATTVVNPVLVTLAPLVNKLGTCVTSLGL